jgi:sugar PTS system EIIA component
VISVSSPVDGRIVALEDVNDQVFAERVMGDGLAVLPDEGLVVSPVPGTIEKLFPGGHAFVVQTPDGVQVLVHLGLETVHLKGDGFTVHASEGDTVQLGDRIVTVDLSRMAELQIDIACPVVVISGHQVSNLTGGSVKAGDPLFDVNV